MKIVICSGGTGGHMFPACSLFEELVDCNDVSLVTDERGCVYAENINNKIVVETIRFSIRNIFTVICQMVRITLFFFKQWRKDKPGVIIGFGGLFTVIPIILAKLLGSKVIIYEQNAVFGKSNFLLGHIADCKASSFDVGNGWIQCAPIVRKGFFSAKEYSYDGLLKIVIIGGSQGAKSFSHIVPDAIALIDVNLRANIEIVQQVKEEDEARLRDVYNALNIKANLFGFIKNFDEVLESAQLVICRSGASTLSELSVARRPAILVPYPHAAANHQFYNAKYYENCNAVWVVEETARSAIEISKIITQILNNKELLKERASNMIKTLTGAQKNIVELINSFDK